MKTSRKEGKTNSWGNKLIYIYIDIFILQTTESKVIYNDNIRWYGIKYYTSSSI